MRKVIHIDMDAFFASVEQRDFPEYRGKPLIVGGKPDSRGVVAACSYEARRFGVHSAMPSSRAYRLCPEAIFVRHRFDVYRQCSEQIRSIFARYTQMIEPLSLDEAFLDVSNSEHCQGSATLIAEQIRSDIKQELNLTASAGVSYNKFLAKIASDLNKPDGLSVIRPEQAEAFISSLPIRKFFGIGKATEAKMHQFGIRTGADLRRHSKLELQQRFGKSGEFYYNIVRGIDERPVRSSRQRKSIGKETTFSQDSIDASEIQSILEGIAGRIAELLSDKNMLARTITLKVKYSDFQQVTRSQTSVADLFLVDDLLSHIPALIARTEIGQRPVRLVGISVSNLHLRNDKSGSDSDQLPLFDNEL